MTRSCAWRVLLAVGLVLVLMTGCLKPLTAPATTPATSTALSTPYDVAGTVDFSDGRRTQATIDDDVAKGATVSLIDVLTGHTLTSARTDTRGRFVLAFSNGFKPVANALYYFEAVKGLDAGSGQANAIGGDAARVRTIGQWKDNQWRTLTSVVTSRIDINSTTTALAVIVSLRANTDRPIDAGTLLGSVDVGTPDGLYPHKVTPPDPVLLPVLMVQRAFDLVADALAKNRDPVRWIQLSSSDPQHETVTLPDAPFSIAYLSPGSATALENVDLVGSNFGYPKEQNQVAFTDDAGATVSATVLSVSPDLGRLTVRVPATAVTGTVYLTLREKTLPGPIFNLAIRDGHSVIGPTGNVYMANKSMGTLSIAKKLPASDRYGVSALVTGLDKPGALTFGREGYPWIYVACGGSAQKVYKADVSLTTPTAVAVTAGTGVANPSGMAFQYATGDLFLTDSTTNTLYKVASGSTAVNAVVLTGTPLGQPRGLSFGPDNRLYVANSGGNNVLAIDVAASNATTYLSGLSSPWGVAFDTRGSLYVSNNAGNSVYRLPVTSLPGEPIVYGALSSFASIPTPGGMDADATGYLFVADNVTNGIYRINQQAESQQIAYGVSYPTSIWADASGQYTLTEAGRILFFDNATQILSVFAEGLTSAVGLVKDSLGNLYTNQTNINSLVRITPDGTAAPVLSGLTTSPNTELHLRNDKIYLRSNTSFDLPSTTYSAQGEVLEFDLAALGAPTRRLRTILRSAVAMARDESGGTYNGYYYVLQDQEASVLRVQRVASNRASIVKVLQDPARLKNPQDIHVDTSGRLWIADYDGPGGTGGLYVYDANGNFLQDYSARVNNPTNLASDGDGVGVYVNSYVSAGDVREVKYADGTLVRTLPGFSYPRGFAFTGDRTRLYVNEWGLNRISYLDGYQTLTTPITNFYASGDCYDIETSGTDVVYTNGGRLSLVESDGVTITASYSPQYLTILRTFKQSDGIFAFVESGGWLNYGLGAYTSWTANLYTSFGRGDYGTVRGAGLVTDTAHYSYGRAGAWTNLSETMLDGSLSRTYYLGTDIGGMATNGTTEVYFTAQHGNGTVYKWTNGSLGTLAGSAYGTAVQGSMGISYYNGQLYQTLRTRHQIDQINATTGARTTLLVGLVAPEL